jgi:hypothetical protein
MKIFADDRICHEAGNLNPGCPHCHKQTALTPLSRPDFATIKACKPAVTGLCFLCLSCRKPLLVRYSVEHIGETEIELAPAAALDVRPDDRINLSYLPASVKKPYVDALGCYQHELIQPFGLMCKQTIDAVIKDLGEGGKLKVFNHLEELRDVFNVEPHIFATIGEVLFDNKRSLMSTSVFGRTEAAVLLEALKDLIYQFYIRKARLQRAVSMRQFFANPPPDAASDLASVSPIRKPG